jgi:alkanesulfonate monooxygenase SsuD/methylene tetrahydromethanopterin reductase-like flavin-dependent oxidoreductase (luciferase family)
MVRPFRFAVLQGIESWSRRELRDLARQVEDLGYDSFQMCDHVAGPGPAMEWTGHPPSGLAAVPTLMALADATERLRVGTLVSCIDYHLGVEQMS